MVLLEDALQSRDVVRAVSRFEARSHGRTRQRLYNDMTRFKYRTNISCQTNEFGPQ